MKILSGEIKDLSVRAVSGYSVLGFSYLNLIWKQKAPTDGVRIKLQTNPTF